MILTNPPFGGKEGKDAQKNFAYETGATQVLFVQHILGELAPERPLRHRAGRRRALPHERGRLRGDQAQAAGRMRSVVHRQPARRRVLRRGAGVKTNLLFFTKGKKTEKIWYYDLSHVKVGKKSPLTLAHFGFGKNGEVLDDADLPAVLTEAGRKTKPTKGNPSPATRDCSLSAAPPPPKAATRGPSTSPPAASRRAKT